MILGGKEKNRVKEVIGNLVTVWTSIYLNIRTNSLSKGENTWQLRTEKFQVIFPMRFRQSGG
jgi:hypothetical protein